LTSMRKDENAPNLPQCRLIEKYWALVKGRMRKYESRNSFKRRWSKCSNFVMQNSGGKLVEDFSAGEKRGTTESFI